MRIAADTNVLLRAFVADDEEQAELAVEALAEAELVAISLQALCEFVWVLSRHYRTKREDIAAALRTLLDTHNVVLNRPAVEAGLSLLDAGGDFADGVIAYEGSWLGAETFVSFDREAVELLSATGKPAVLLKANHVESPEA